jgi:hypothetical protein
MGENASMRPVIRSSNARPDIDHDVAVMHREIRLVGAVHAEHPEELRLGARIGSEAIRSR